MGLDMYMGVKAYVPLQNRDRLFAQGRAVGHPIKRFEVETAYWRKHPNLHGRIVEKFAGGIDDCREIELTIPDLIRLMDDVMGGTLPTTEGFFFGASSTPEDGDAYLEQVDRDLAKLACTIETFWDLEAAGYWCTIYYRASW